MRRSTSPQLRRLLESPDIARAVGAGDGVAAILANRHDFDALWVSGLAVSALHGVPDASIVTMTELLAAARVMVRRSRLPVIADCDTGFGDVALVHHMVREFEDAGVAGVCIEDKQFPKRNSFSGGQHLLPAKEFARKVWSAKRAQQSADFVVIARIEALIAGAGMGEALDRAACYQDAGADAIVIHSRQSTAHEVLTFSELWQKRADPRPLIAIPTTYYTVRADQLADAGFSMVIYANQALRAAIQAVDRVFGRMSISASTATVEPELAKVEDVLELIGTDELEEIENAAGAARL